MRGPVVFRQPTGIAMPVSSGLTSHYDWTCVDRRNAGDCDVAAVQADWRGRTLMTGACDNVSPTTTFSELAATFSGVDESFYAHQHHQQQQQQQQPWTNTTSRCSGVNSYVDDSGDRYTRNVTSFGIFDVTKTSDVSRCDVRNEKVVAAQYRCSPTARQKSELGGPYGDGQSLYSSNSSDMAEIMSATYGSLQTVLEPCGPVIDHNQTMQFTPPPSVNEWRGDVEISEGEASCDVMSFMRPSSSLTGSQLTTSAESGTTYELIELQTQRAVTSNHIVRSCRQLQRHDSQLSSPAAAADTSVTDLNSDGGRRQSELERIKKAKHNRVEKRRRSNINEHMKTLGSLLPRSASSGSCKIRQNKGNILKETVAYIRLLQQDQARLVTVEQRTRQLYSANRHIIARLKELEDLLSTSERYSVGDTRLLIDDLDAHIKKELSSVAAVNARTCDEMLTCAL